MPTTSVTHQTREQQGGEGSIVARQQADHHDLEVLMRAYEAGLPVADRPEHLRELCRVALQHAFAEETVLFPAARRLLPEGDPLTGEIEGDHQEINEQLVAVADLDPDDPEHEARVARLFTLLREDARTEEDLLLPRLQEVTGDEQLRRIGAAWEASKQTAPTRPHPAIPRRPPGNLVTGLPLSVLDRGRDLLDRAGGPGRVAVLAATVLVVRSLRRLAH